MVIPGIPEGYRAVRWGRAEKGEYYIGHAGIIAPGPSALPHLIVELINKPIEAGEGYRLIDKTVDTPQLGDEYWSKTNSIWTTRTEQSSRFYETETYRRRIPKTEKVTFYTEKVTFYTEKVTFYEVVDTSRFHAYRELIWIDRICFYHTPTGNRIEIEVPVKQ